VITEIPAPEAINPTLDGNAPSQIFEFVKPLLVRIRARCSKLMADFHWRVF
jgi:hypothetical protein